MGFSVYLKGDDTPVKIDAELVISDDKVLLFSKSSSVPTSAVVPLDNVWYVVKDQA